MKWWLPISFVLQLVLGGVAIAFGTSFFVKVYQKAHPAGWLAFAVWVLLLVFVLYKCWREWFRLNTIRKLRMDQKGDTP